MDLDRHPFLIIELLQDQYDDDIEFEFSKYVHTQQQLLDNRRTFRLKGSEISASWARQVFESLSDDEELAIHSKVRRRDRNYHIPMIDFVSGDWSQKLESEIRKYLPRRVARELVVFSTGRSFHAYGLYLLEPKEWIDFMGRLLLINPPGNSEFVDARWIGHRLIGGFSSLRWSCNTSNYKKYPEFLEDSLRIKIVAESSLD